MQKREQHNLTKTREYNSWSGMRSRIYNPKNKKFHRYGGRGIKICKRWESFLIFLNDMGACPQGHTLDRINVNGDYEPKNCRWASQKIQQNNRENNRWLIFNGQKRLVTEWEVITKIPAKIIRQRIDRDKMTVENALKSPLKIKRNLPSGIFLRNTKYRVFVYNKRTIYLGSYPDKDMALKVRNKFYERQTFNVD